MFPNIVNSSMILCLMWFFAKGGNCSQPPACAIYF
ncbi:hypothetical protein GLYMA_17G127025v4 [Glycine max]|nr:hypothetical protein GLYMA_17G127025v4 [Glycine max]KAH1118203.1 hypothetical protein GYH30_047102 [Glycine max]